jgi:hypothetical protein
MRRARNPTHEVSEHHFIQQLHTAIQTKALTFDGFGIGCHSLAVFLTFIHGDTRFAYLDLSLNRVAIQALLLSSAAFIPHRLTIKRDSPSGMPLDFNS